MVEFGIAIKAMSPATNYSTTAVLAIDHIHRLRRMGGHRQLQGDPVRDPARSRATRVEDTERG